MVKILYLSNRTQQVCFNDKWSKLIVTEYGVPQKPVLGFLLFIIYINDINKICPEGCIRMFAGDTLIYVTSESSERLESKMNMTFNMVEEWMNVNKLKMNAGKTKYMIVRSVKKELKKILY